MGKKINRINQQDFLINFLICMHSHVVLSFCFFFIENNKEILMRLGVVDPLVDLLNSKNVEVQCNTCGCITALATTGKH